MAFGLPEIIGAIGAIGGLAGNQRNADRAASLTREQIELMKAQFEDTKRLTDRQVKLFDLFMSIYDRESSAGTFDPTRRIGMLESGRVRRQGVQLGNTAGALRSVGYKPGDGTPERVMSNAQATLQRDNMEWEDAVRRQSLQDELTTLGAVNPGILGSAIAASGQAAAGYANSLQTGAGYYAGQVQNPAGYINSLMPFFDSNNYKKGSGGMVAEVVTNPVLNTPPQRAGY